MTMERGLGGEAPLFTPFVSGVRQLMPRTFGVARGWGLRYTD